MRELVRVCCGLLMLFHLTSTRCVRKSDDVFLTERSADSFLSRTLLYNKFDFELVVPGNLERECNEEVCSYEEAREVFEDDQKTADFWKTYKHNGNNGSSGTSQRLDVAGLVSGVVAAVIAVFIVAVLIWYCYKNRNKNKPVERAGSVPVRMASDDRSAPEMVPLSSIAAPGLPSYNEALNRSGQHDAPPPPYSGEPTATSEERQTQE